MEAKEERLTLLGLHFVYFQGNGLVYRDVLGVATGLYEGSTTKLILFTKQHPTSRFTITQDLAPFFPNCIQYLVEARMRKRRAKEFQSSVKVSVCGGVCLCILE